jgi:hypothetical protein
MAAKTAPRALVVLDAKGSGGRLVGVCVGLLVVLGVKLQLKETVGD